MPNNTTTHPRPHPAHPSSVRERLDEAAINIASRHVWEQPHLQDTANLVRETFMPQLIGNPVAQTSSKPIKNKRPKLYLEPSTTEHVVASLTDHLRPEPQHAIKSNQRLPRLSHLVSRSTESESEGHLKSPVKKVAHLQIGGEESRFEGVSMSVDNGPVKISESRNKTGTGTYQTGDNNQNDDDDEGDDRGWDIESRVPAKLAHVDPITEKDTYREKASMIIENMSEPWKLIFDKASDNVKSDFQHLATQIASLLENDGILAKAIGDQLGLSISTSANSMTKIIDESGEALEAIVQIQTTNEVNQTKLFDLEEDNKNLQKDFLKKLAKCQARHSEEIEEMRMEIETERNSFETLIQKAKSDKNEKKEMHKKLAVLLADEAS